MFAPQIPFQIKLAILLMTAMAAGHPAGASPLDLSDPTPRWVEVRFEISPDDQPGRLDRRWSSALPAYLVQAAPGHVEIQVPAESVETHLRSIGTEALPGTFSPFTWTIDPTTGHVLRAAMTGRVRQPIAVGLLRTTVAVDIRVEMTTRGRGGFLPESRVMGQKTHGFCDEPGQDSDCIFVPPQPLDPDDGYVNAVGSVRAEIPLTRRQVFSPLGEARFSERQGKARAAGSLAIGSAAVESGPADEDTVCSVSFGGSC